MACGSQGSTSQGMGALWWGVGGGGKGMAHHHRTRVDARSLFPLAPVTKGCLIPEHETASTAGWGPCAGCTPALPSSNNT